MSTPEQLVVRHISNWSQMDYTEQIARINQLAQSFPIARSAVDQTGVGEAVVEGMKLKVPNLEGIKFTQEVKEQLITSLRLLLEQKKLTLPNDPKLIMQLNSLHYTISAVGNMIFHTPEKNEAHDDYVWALALAAHAARRGTPQITLIGAKRNW